MNRLLPILHFHVVVFFDRQTQVDTKSLGNHLKNMFF